MSSSITNCYGDFGVLKFGTPKARRIKHDRHSLIRSLFSLGRGLKLFENIGTNKVKLERIKVEKTTSIRTSITFKVKKTKPVV